MNRLIFVTQVIDPDDPVLGYVAGPITALATRFDEVVVVANEVRSDANDLGVRVLSLGKESGRGRLARGAAYQSILASLALQGRRQTTLLAHMCPLYLTLAAPVARARRITTMLWFSHPRDSRALAAAERAADAVLTALPGSYPRPSAKVHVIGQTVDTSIFRPQSRPGPGGALRLLAIGRVSPVKNLELVVRALGLARHSGVDATLTIVGPSLGAAGREHRRHLAVVAESLCLSDSVTFAEPVPHDRVPDLIHGCSAVVNATSGGSADKVVFEAMACGRPVLASNPALADALSASPVSLRFTEGDPASLARRLAELAATPADVWARLGAAMRDEVVSNHSNDHWAGRVAEIAADTARR